LEQLKSSPIVPVFFHADAEYARQILAACYAGGLRFFEFTNRGAAAFEVFEALAQHAKANCPGLYLGIGTIYTAEDAERFIGAGADFIVQPVTTAAVADVCKKHSIPWIPGAMTLNEIWTAWQLGAGAVKVFPGNMVGPDYIRALRGPMPGVPLMVTGGVEPTIASINEWLGAGVQAVGIGSPLFKGDFSKDFSTLRARISGLLEGILQKTLVFATNNPNKAKEVELILGSNYTIKTLKDIGCNDDIEETELTLEGNALLKARYVKDKYGYDCFSEDTGLEVEALGGAPGVHTARYAGEGRDPEDNIQLLLQNLEGKDNRNARFRTVIALIVGETETLLEGVCEGQIAHEKSGTGGFGYDPIFMPDGYDQTFAVLGYDVKNKVSHRAKAMEKLLEVLR